MGHRIRWWAPGVRYYEIVAKCCGDEMLMRPDPLAVFLLGLALAIACKAFPRVRVISFCFVSNHMHLVLHVETDEEPKLTPILDDLHLARRMTYTHTQPVHHQLVERVEEWPGLSSFRAVCEGKTSVEAAYFDEEAWREAGARPSEVADYTETVSVPLTMPATWRGLSERELRTARRAHEQSVRERERREAVGRASRGENRRLAKGAHDTRINPFERPEAPSKKGPQPWAHADERAEKEFYDAYRLMLEVYEVASAKFRATGVLGVFPRTLQATEHIPSHHAPTPPPAHQRGGHGCLSRGGGTARRRGRRTLGPRRRRRRRGERAAPLPARARRRLRPPRRGARAAVRPRHRGGGAPRRPVALLHLAPP